MALTSESLLDEVKLFCSENKPSCDPSCIELFNRIRWDIIPVPDVPEEDSDSEEIDVGVVGCYSVDGGTWTEPFGTTSNYLRWCEQLSKYLAEKFHHQFIIAEDSEAGVQYIDITSE